MFGERVLGDVRVYMEGKGFQRGAHEACLKAKLTLLEVFRTWGALLA